MAIAALERLDIAQTALQPRRHAVGRPAAARGDRPRPDAAAQGDARRRADRLARSAQRQGGDGRAARHQSARRHHRHHQSAHARYRPHLLQPHHRHGRRQGRVRRPAGGADREAVRMVYGTDSDGDGDLRGHHLDQHQRVRSRREDTNPPVRSSPLSPGY